MARSKKLSELPATTVLNGSDLIPICQSGGAVSIDIDTLKRHLKADILKEMAAAPVADPAKNVSTTAAVALGAGAIIAKSPPVTRRFFRLFGK